MLEALQYPVLVRPKSEVAAEPQPPLLKLQDVGHTFEKAAITLRSARSPPPPGGPSPRLALGADALLIAPSEAEDAGNAPN